MKKIFIVLVICFLSVFNVLGQTVTQEDIQKNIIGKWKTVVENENEVVTNLRSIKTFFDDGTGIYSNSKDGRWLNKTKITYSVLGNHLHQHYTEVTLDIEQTVSNIYSKYLYCTDFSSSQLPHMSGKSDLYIRVTADYSSAILGTWEGISFDGENTYGDVFHRWEYRADGSYNYYEKDKSGKWIEGTNLTNEYSVDGDWLVCKWTDKNGKEFSECWDIQSCDDSMMVWTALRGRKDGSRFHTKFVMKKIK